MSSPETGAAASSPEEVSTDASDDTAEDTTGDTADESESTAYPLVDLPADAEVPCLPEGGLKGVWLDAEGADTDGPDVMVLGDGTTGVVLLHQNDGRPCSWLPFAATLVDEGYSVAIPVMEPGDWPQPIIGSAVEHLHGSDDTPVALVGASMGGTYALAAAPPLADQLSGVVAVSAPDFYRGADAIEAVTDLAVPSLLLAAEGEERLAQDAQAMGEAASGDASVEIRPGSAHGIELLGEDEEAATLVLDFLAGLSSGG